MTTQTSVSLNSAPDVAALIEKDRIRGSVYTNEALFEQEMKKIFHSGWVFVGHDSEIPSAGEYVRRTLGLEEVLMVRQRDDSIAVLVNRCTHRGNMLRVEKHGKEKYFTCAYHGWVFDLGGQSQRRALPWWLQERQV